MDIPSGGLNDFPSNDFDVERINSLRFHLWSKLIMNVNPFGVSRGICEYEEIPTEKCPKAGPRKSGPIGKVHYTKITTISFCTTSPGHPQWWWQCCSGAELCAGWALSPPPPLSTWWSFSSLYGRFCCACNWASSQGELIPLSAVQFKLEFCFDSRLICEEPSVKLICMWFAQKLKKGAKDIMTLNCVRMEWHTVASHLTCSWLTVKVDSRLVHSLARFSPFLCMHKWSLNSCVAILHHLAACMHNLSLTLANCWHGCSLHCGDPIHWCRANNLFLLWQLVDFRFAKEMSNERTFTICGMADFLAPEIIKGQGHSLAADWYALSYMNVFIWQYSW